MFSDDDDYDERPGSSASSSSELSSSCSESDIKDVCYILNTKGLSEESLLLLKEIRRQRLLFEDRVDNHQTSLIFLAKFMNIMNVNNIIFKNFPQRNITYHASRLAYFAGTKNLIDCFKEIRELEASYGDDLWILNFVIMHNLLIDMDEVLATVLFRSSIIDTYLKCSIAISKRQWYLVAKHISAIQFIFKMRLTREELKTLPTDKLGTFSTTIRHRSEPATFYLTSLFLASAQRNLELGKSPEFTLKLIEKTVSRFYSTCKHRMSLWANPSSFFVLNGLIFKLCHGFYNSILQSTETPLTQVDEDWQRASYVYRMVAEYELFRSKKELQRAQLFVNSIEGQFDSLAHKEHTLILLPIFVELCVYLDEGELLFEKLNAFCIKCPALFTHVCRVLIANGCNEGPLLLFGNLVVAKPDDVITVEAELPESFTFKPESLAFSNVTPDLLKEYSKDPASHGAVTEIVKKNLQIAFAILDYGRNRYNLAAWQTLHENLKRVESSPAIINEFWTNRKSWWLRFHSLDNDTTECRKVKKKCFKRLKDIC